MALFNRNNWKGELARELKEGRVDFKFDQKGLRYRLLAEIEEHQLDTAERRVRQHARKPFLMRHPWAAMAAVILLATVGSSMALANGNLTQPGDPLYALDRMQEQVILVLPWPATQKAKIRADIVDERTRELERALEHGGQPEVTSQALDESIRSLDRAVEAVRSSRDAFAGDDRGDQAVKMDQVLLRLQELAEKQEQKVRSMQEKEADESARQAYEQRLKEIQSFRAKARGENEAKDGQVQGENIRQEDSNKNENGSVRDRGQVR